MTHSTALLALLAFSAVPDAGGGAAPRAVTMKGNPMRLSGPALRAGDPAPAFTARDTALAVQAFDPKSPGVKILVSVPSLNTPVCDRETRRFNEEAASLGANVSVRVLSMDLPFAQKAWCGAAGVERVIPLSDHFDANFGERYGVLMPDLRLLARAVFVIDAKGILRHVEIVPEVAGEPDYDAALAAARAAAK